MFKYKLKFSYCTTQQSKISEVHQTTHLTMELQAPCGFQSKNYMWRKVCLRLVAVDTVCAKKNGNWTCEEML